MNYYLIITLIMYTVGCNASSHLDSIRDYVHSIPGFPKVVNKDWFDPEFEDQHKGFSALYHYLVNSFKRKVLGYKQFWSTNLFMQQLTKNFQIQKSRDTKIPYIHLQGSNSSTFFVWGDMYGSFHALVDALEFLYKEQIIDKNLNIIKPDHYFIFLGNIIDRSSRSFETMLIVLLLANHNPGKVFYIRGQEESNGYWHSFGLNREIQQKFTWNVTKIGLIRDQLDEYFASLPQAVFVSLTPDTIIEFTYDADPQLVHTFIQNIKLQPEYVRAIIQGQDYIPIKVPAPNLELLPFLEFTTVYWKVFSAYNSLFKTDGVRSAASFAKIEIKPTLKESLIIDYEYKNKTFIAQEERLLFSGEYEREYKKFKEADRPVVVVGSSMDFSDEFGPVGREFSTGLQTTFLFYNISGANTYLIKNYILNDYSKPYLARNNINVLLEKYHAEAIISPLGDETVTAITQQLKKLNIPLLFPVAGTHVLRDPALTNVINLEPSYEEEIAVLLEYIMKNFLVRRFALVSFHGHDSKEILDTAHKVLQKTADTEWIDIIYADRMSDFSTQIEKLTAFGPQAIGFLGAPFEIRAFISKIGIDYIYDKICFFVSLAAHESFKAYMHSVGIQSIFANAMPHPEKSNLQIVKEYRELMKKAESPLSTTVSYLVDAHTLQSYIGATVFLDALKKLGSPFNAQKLLEIIEGYNNYQFKGLTLTFNPKNRSLTQPVWLEYDYDADWIALFPKS